MLEAWLGWQPHTELPYIGKGVLPEEFLTTCRVVKDVEQHTEEGEWMNWSKAVAEIGLKPLLAMVEAKTVLTRRDPRLPVDSDLEWPEDQQVQNIVEKFKNKHQMITTRRLQTRGGYDTHQQNHEGSQENKVEVVEEAEPQEAEPQVAQGEPEPQEKPVEVVEEAEKVSVIACLFALRKAHGSWDRTKRAWGALELSKIEAKHLDSLIAEGDKVDEKLTKMEAKHLQGNKLSKNDIKEACTWCHDMAELMKKSAKKGLAIHI